MAAACVIQEGEKWCNGPCGRPLPLAAFRSNGQGGRASFCNGCHRVDQRGRYRRRYRVDAAFRRREKERSNASYQARRARALCGEVNPT